jgi:hypothetical protein
VRGRPATWIAWIVALAAVAVMLHRLLPVARAQLTAPYDLISEGPHMCTVQAIERGFDIYASRNFLDLPFYVTPYTPLYHSIVAALPQDPANPFFTGRVVSTILNLLAASALLFVAAPAHRATGVTAFAVFFLLHAVTGNTVYLRSDGLALCASIWAVVTVARATRRSHVVAAGALAALAVAGKQSFLAAGVVSFAFVALRRPRDLPAFVASGLAVGLGLAAAATAVWGTEFWFAVTIPLSDYPRAMESFRWHWHLMFIQPIFVWIVGAALVTLAATRTTRGPLLAYALVAWALQSSVMTGVGAENHNLIEPVLATLLWMVAALQAGGTPLTLGWLRLAGLATLAACVVLELRQTDTTLYSYADPARTARYVANRAEAQARLRGLGFEHGKLLNLKNSQIPHDFPNSDMTLNDLWMYATVLWDSRPETVDRLIAAIEAERFDVVITAPGVTTPTTNPRNGSPWSRIVYPLFDHYRVAFHGGDVNLLTRRSVTAAR